MAELVVALDFSSRQEALDVVGQLGSGLSWVKVGLELFLSAGPDVLAALKRDWPELRVFLDLKIYDIPNTAAMAALACARMGADMITIHCQGGERMCAAVMESLAGLDRRPLVLGVTALTSFAAGEMPGVASEPDAYGFDLAMLASQWGLDGVVCSGLEVEAIKSSAPSLLAACPGIRPAGSSANDQARVMTPARVVAAGADFLVVGRPITRSRQPFVAMMNVLEEMRRARRGG